MPLEPFDRKIVIVTGGGSGIGRATALAFGQAGAIVIVSGRRQEPCEATVRQIHDRGGHKGFALAADVGCEADVARLFSTIHDRFGQLDAAFFNAGTSGKGSIADQSYQEFDRIMRANCHGLWLCLQHALRMMIKQKSGSIVSNLSVHSSRTISCGTAAYTASKHAALALTKAAAYESAAHGVRVNGVAPGPVLTEMLAQSTRGAGGVEGWAKRIPQGRVGRPEEIAAAVLWLSSADASFVNGAILPIDGAFLST